MRRLAIVQLIVGVSTVALAVAPCKTDEELMAEVTLGFFTAQRLAAEACDAAFPPEKPSVSLVRFHGRIAGKFHERLLQAEEIRAGYFRRTYGENWVDRMHQVDLAFIERVTSAMRISEAGCREQRAKLQRRAEAGWPYIAGRLQEAAQEQRGRVPRCRE